MVGRRVESPYIVNVNGNGLNEMKYCATCKIYRPSNLTSHCRECNVCIKVADHHCKWLGTCIGVRNYKYFFYLAFFLMLYSFLVFIACLVYWGTKARELSKTEKRIVNNYDLWNVMASSPFILPLTFYAFCALLFSSVLFGYHLLSVLSYGTTTQSLIKHESSIPWRHSPFDRLSLFSSLEYLLYH